MTGQGVRWTAEQVLALAPDDASRRAGSKLSAPGPWSEAGAGTGAVWGMCKGSGSKPYRTVVDLEGADGVGYKCSCPSRKFPCKHALGLLLLWASGQGEQEATGWGDVQPGWAGEWLTGRRERASDRAAARSGSAAADDDGDPAARQAAAEAAQRRSERRVQRIAAGATELEERLTDLLRGGLAGADQRGYAAWDETAARMVDAQAPGLAARVRELGSLPASGRGDPGAGGGWPERMLSECALLHLLNRGFLALDGLPEPLAATVRTRVGLTVDSAELLAEDAGTDRVRDEWLVLAQRDAEEGRLTARRIWLRGRASGRPALLLSYAAAGRAPDVALPVGTVFDAELCFYPGARALRAALGPRHAAADTGFVPEGGTVTEALAAYGAALCDDPWLEGWPAVLRDVVPVPGADGGHGWQVADAEGEFALPVTPGTSSTALWKLTAISGGAPVTVFGECGHRGFAPYTAWSGEDAVQL